MTIVAGTGTMNAVVSGAERLNDSSLRAACHSLFAVHLHCLTTPRQRAAGIARHRRAVALWQTACAVLTRCRAAAPSGTMAAGGRRLGDMRWHAMPRDALSRFAHWPAT